MPILVACTVGVPEGVTLLGESSPNYREGRFKCHRVHTRIPTGFFVA